MSRWPMQSFSERLWSKIRQGELDECWPWTAHKHPSGYGMIQAPDCSRPLWAHREAYQLTYGLFADDMEVMHRCDNPACCNPTHLCLGTHHANMLDMASKGRRSVEKFLATTKANDSFRKGWETRRARIVS